MTLLKREMLYKVYRESVANTIQIRRTEGFMILEEFHEGYYLTRFFGIMRLMKAVYFIQRFFRARAAYFKQRKSLALQKLEVTFLK